MTPMCIVEGCARPHIARSFCTKHYQRWKRGVPLDSYDKAPNGAHLAFLRSLLGTKETACIPWPFSRTQQGQGTTYFEGQGTTASRIMCLLAHGEPPDPALEAAHNCGKGHEGCVNPNHLRWATKIDNHADKVGHGTLLWGSNVHMAVLTESDVADVRARLARRESCASIARSYGVTGGCIEAIKNGKNWKRLPA